MLPFLVTESREGGVQLAIAFRRADALCQWCRGLSCDVLAVRDAGRCDLATGVCPRCLKSRRGSSGAWSEMMRLCPWSAVQPSRRESVRAAVVLGPLTAAAISAWPKNEVKELQFGAWQLQHGAVGTTSTHLAGSVAAVVSLCPRLESLNLNGLPTSHAKAAKAAALSCPQLRIVSASSCVTDGTSKEGLSDEVMCQLVKRCPRLEAIQLTHSGPSITDVAIIAIAQECHALTDLSVSATRCITDAGLLSLGARCKTLRYLDVGASVNVGDDGVIAVARGCRQLRCLLLNGLGEHLTDRSIIEVARCCPDLRYLDIRGTRVTDDGVIAIASHCIMLGKLNVSSAITDRGVVAIAGACRRLWCFSAGSSKGVSAAGLSALSACRELSHLALGQTSVTDEGLCALAASPLGLLRLSVLSVNYSGRRVTDVGMVAVLKRCAWLKHLHVTACGIADETICVAVDVCGPFLHTIDAAGNDRVTDASLLAIAQGCAALASLHVHGTSVTELGLTAVVDRCARSLTYLSVPVHSVSQEWVAVKKTVVLQISRF